MLFADRRSIRAVVFVAVTCLTAAGAGFSADLDDLLGNAREKKAAYEKVVKDITIAQEIKVDAQDKKAEGESVVTKTKIFRKGPKMRLESEIGGAQQAGGGAQPMRTIIISDGKDTWMISELFGKRKLGKENQGQTEKDWWERMSETAKVTGSEEINGSPCHVVTTDDGAKLWIEKSTKNLLQMETAGGKKGKDRVTVVFSEYRKIKGDIVYPYRTDASLNGKHFSTTLVTSIEVNKNLPDALFNPDGEKPAGGPKVNMKDLMKQMIPK